MSDKTVKLKTTTGDNLIDKYVEENGIVGGTTLVKNSFIFINSTGVNTGAGKYRYFKSSKTQGLTKEITNNADITSTSNPTFDPVELVVDKTFNVKQEYYKKDALTTLPDGQLALQARIVNDINNKISLQIAIAIYQGLHNNSINAGAGNQKVLSKAINTYATQDDTVKLATELQDAIDNTRLKVDNKQDIEQYENSQLVIALRSDLVSRLRLLKAFIPNPTAEKIINGLTPVGTFDGIQVIEVSKVLWNDTYKINGTGEAELTNMGKVVGMVAPIGNLGAIAMNNERAPQMKQQESPKNPLQFVEIFYDLNYGLAQIFTGVVTTIYENGTTAPTTGVTFSAKSVENNVKTISAKRLQELEETSERKEEALKEIEALKKQIGTKKVKGEKND